MGSRAQHHDRLIIASVATLTTLAMLAELVECCADVYG